MAKEKLAVVEDVTEADPIEVAFTAATEAGKEGDDVKMEMIKAGAAFKSVTNLFNKFMVSSGKAMSVDQKKELLDTSLNDAVLDNLTSVQSNIMFEQFKTWVEEDGEAPYTGKASVFGRKVGSVVKNRRLPWESTVGRDGSKTVRVWRRT